MVVVDVEDAVALVLGTTFTDRATAALGFQHGSVLLRSDAVPPQEAASAEDLAIFLRMVRLPALRPLDEPVDASSVSLRVRLLPPSLVLAVAQHAVGEPAVAA